MRQHIVVGLDVGTTKISAVAAALQDSMVEILGLGVVPSSGLRKGVVVSIDETIDAIRKALREAEASAGIRVRAVSVGISGSHIKSLQSRGAAGVRGREVSPADVERVIESSKTVSIPLERDLLHALPTGFIIDGHEGIQNPVGMSGMRLEAVVNIITGNVSCIQNLLKCCEHAGVDVVDLVFSPLAAARAVFKPAEKEAGVVLLDIGGGTTEIALFNNGNLCRSAVLGLGGGHITNDIAVGMRIPMSEAERIKKSQGTARPDGGKSPAEVLVTQVGGQVKALPHELLQEIIQARCTEMLELAKDELRGCRGYEQPLSGIVLTGGTALMKGLPALAEEVLALPVRVGLPEMPGSAAELLRDPQYAAGVGLVTYGSFSDRQQQLHPVSSNSLLGRVKHWARDLFRHSETIHSEYKKEGGMACSKSRK